jgi:hypothetical protein
MEKAKKIAAGWWEFMGWEIEKMEEGHWNMKPKGECFWTDAAESLKEAKEMIQEWEAA